MEGPEEKDSVSTGNADGTAGSALGDLLYIAGELMEPAADFAGEVAEKVIDSISDVDL